MNIVFWQNEPSIHQAPFLKALRPLWKDRFDGDVIVCCENDLSSYRQNNGWDRPDYGGCVCVVAPSDSERNVIISGNGDNQPAIHVFSGFDMTPINNRTLRALLKAGERCWIVSERPRDDEGIKSILRFIKYCYFAKRYKNIEALLGMGQISCRYFERCGFDKAKLFPFGYFTKAIKLKSPDRYIDDRCVNLGYVGNVNAWKGLDLLMQACVRVNVRDYKLHVIGMSQEGYSNAWGPISKEIQDNIIWHDVLPNAQVRDLLQDMDYLIIPSRYDGWGAVCNEALQAGCRVLVSNRAGACDLIMSDLDARQADLRQEDVRQADGEVPRGYVIDPYHSDAFVSYLKQAIDGGALTYAERIEIHQWANEKISPEAGAEYFCNIVSYLSSINTLDRKDRSLQEKEREGGQDGIFPPYAPWFCNS